MIAVHLHKLPGHVLPEEVKIRFANHLGRVLHSEAPGMSLVDADKAALISLK